MQKVVSASGRQEGKRKGKKEGLDAERANGEQERESKVEEKKSPSGHVQERQEGNKTANRSKRARSRNEKEKKRRAKKKEQERQETGSEEQESKRVQLSMRRQNGGKRERGESLTAGKREQ